MRHICFAILLALSSTSCAGWAQKDVFATIADAGTTCGPGVLSESGAIAGAFHSGGGDWTNIFGLVASGLGDVVCIARVVTAHVKAHQSGVAGPGGMGLSPGELERLTLIRALARSVEKEKGAYARQ